MIEMSLLLPARTATRDPDSLGQAGNQLRVRRLFGGTFWREEEPGPENAAQESIDGYS